MRILMVLASSIMGGLIGVTAAFIYSAFIPACGEDCFHEKFTCLVTGIILGIVIFSAYSASMIKHPKRSIKNIIYGYVGCCMLLLIPAFSYYVYKLHVEYKHLLSNASAVPNADLPHMAITTRTIKARMTSGGMQQITWIPSWERCLIGVSHCEEIPRQVEVLCKSRVLKVNEDDWSAFTLIPSENATGVVPLKSMRLCDDDEAGVKQK